MDDVPLAHSAFDDALDEHLVPSLAVLPTTLVPHSVHEVPAPVRILGRFAFLVDRIPVLQLLASDLLLVHLMDSLLDGLPVGFSDEEGGDLDR